MDINPFYQAIGKLFSKNICYKIPKYQRGYAWSNEEIKEFIDDIDTNLTKRIENQSNKGYFFGGILAVQYSNHNGITNETRYDIIDGQQRITTFTLLANAIMLGLESITPKDDFVNDQIQELREDFIAHKAYKNKQPLTINVLTLSNKDDKFYRDLLDGLKPKPTADSHEKIQNASEKLNKYIKSQLKGKSTEEKKDILSHFIDLIKEDLNVLLMTTSNQDDAYLLFEVINDRGKNLSESDLLRTRILQLADNFENESRKIEYYWNNILKENPKDVIMNLNWIFESNLLRRPKKSSLTSEFIKHFYNIDNSDASMYKEPSFITDTLVDKTRQLSEEMELCTSLRKSEWPYEKIQARTYKKSVLSFLLNDLGHTKSIPLLLAAKRLDEKVYLELISTITRFFIRYKTVCEGHETHLSKIYLKEIERLRNDNSHNTLDLIKKDLNDLIRSRADDATLRLKLEQIRYTNNTSKNKKIKAILVTIEKYISWYLSTSTKKTPSPSQSDISIVYDTSTITIEHINPQSSTPKLADNFLHGLGNLTLITTSQNSACSNKLLKEKYLIYESSSIQLNALILSKTKSNAYSWGTSDIEQRKEEIKDILCEILIP